MKKQRKILIVTEQEQIEFYGKLEYVCSSLDRRFLRCLQYLVINMDKVVRMEKQNIYFTNGEIIGLGRDSFVRSKQQFIAYLKDLL